MGFPNTERTQPRLTRVYSRCKPFGRLADVNVKVVCSGLPFVGEKKHTNVLSECKSEGRGYNTKPGWALLRLRLVLDRGYLRSGLLRTS